MQRLLGITDLRKIISVGDICFPVPKRLDDVLSVFEMVRIKWAGPIGGECEGEFGECTELHGF